MVRRITQNEDILTLVEFILIASLNLSKDLTLGKTHSVYFMTTVVPIPGHPPDPTTGKQRMALKILSVQNERMIESHCALIGKQEERDMVRRGMPQSEIDKTVSANFVWQPWPDSQTVNYNWRRITPEKIKAFKAFKLPSQIHGFGPPTVVNAATLYVE